MKNITLGAKGLLAAALLLTAVQTAPVYAQQTGKAPAMAAPKMAKTMAGVTMAPLPTNVLLFPAVIIGENNAVVASTPANKVTQEIVTDAVRKYLAKGGVGVVVYSNRLPSIQRAVNEGQGVRADDAAKGPGDDTRLAQRLAEIAGATEYITVTVDNYAYDAKSRRATFNLSLERKAADGAALSTAAEKAVGESPSDVAAPRQQESATAHAADLVAEQSVQDIYPQTATIFHPTKVVVTKKKRSPLGWLIPVAAVGGLLLIPR